MYRVIAQRCVQRSDIFFSSFPLQTKAGAAPSSICAELSERDKKEFGCDSPIREERKTTSNEIGSCPLSDAAPVPSTPDQEREAAALPIYASTVRSLLCTTVWHCCKGENWIEVLLLMRLASETLRHPRFRLRRSPGLLHFLTQDNHRYIKIKSLMSIKT